MHQQEPNFSTDFLIKTAFEYELTNKLKLCNMKESNAQCTQIIVDYLEKRIKEIKEKYA